MKLITLEKPLFLTNEDWFYFDEDEMMYKLTDKATEEAKESYEAYYKMLEDDDG